MANITDVRIMEDGWRNAVVKVVGDLDSGDVSLSPLITTAQFTNNNSKAGSLVGFNVHCLQWSMSTGLEITLEWVSNSPQLIAPLAGRGHMKFQHVGGLNPDRTISGYNGSINLHTIGASGGTFVTGQHANFTLLLELTKIYN